MTGPPAARTRFETIRLFKEFHSSGYFCPQLPGRIVFDYKQLSSATRSAKVS